MKLECSIEEFKLLFKNFAVEDKKEELAQKESTSSIKRGNPYVN